MGYRTVYKTPLLFFLVHNLRNCEIDDVFCLHAPQDIKYVHTVILTSDLGRCLVYFAAVLSLSTDIITFICLLCA